MNAAIPRGLAKLSAAEKTRKELNLKVHKERMKRLVWYKNLYLVYRAILWVFLSLILIGTVGVVCLLGFGMINEVIDPNCRAEKSKGTDGEDQIQLSYKTLVADCGEKLREYWPNGHDFDARVSVGPASVTARCR